MISPTDIKILKKYYREVSDDIDISFLQTESDKLKTILQELRSCRFCPLNIVAYTERCTHILHLKLSNIIYYIYYQNTCHVPPMSTIIKSIKNNVAMTRFFGMSNIYNVHIIASPYKRFFPAAKSTLISVENINGGYTDTNTNNIYILRSEEFSKVILHEILHHCKRVHNVEEWTSNQISRLKYEFNIDKDCSLIPNEAVVELWANIMHCLFLSFYYKISYKVLLSKELEYSLIQSSKILEKQKKLFTGKWNEYTNAYCYIIFKCILLKNMDKLDRNSMLKPDYITEFLIKNKESIMNYIIPANTNRSLKICKTSDF